MPAITLRGVEGDGRLFQFSCGLLLSTNVLVDSDPRDVVTDAWPNVINSLSYTSISWYNRASISRQGGDRALFTIPL